ncbi:MAG: hypothetical protein AAF766_16075 [Cyanobacteria bacterium P01_D01_bin.14]
MVPIFFYIPKKLLPPRLPAQGEGFWHWQNSQAERFRQGRYFWTIQTYFRLCEAGVDCQLVGNIPQKGILIAHWDSLPNYFMPGPELLCVCIQADRPKHAYAQIHIVQNPLDASSQAADTCQGSLNRGNFHIRHWPQPDLIPRSPDAGDRFRRVVHMGWSDSIAPELLSDGWRQKLSAMGLEWAIVSPDRWHDYSNVDAILSVRSFDYVGQYLYKPASKLINAWQAGVPAILGRESAFRAERQSELDYIEVTSVDEALAALIYLQNGPVRRTAMIENGRQRAQSTSASAVVTAWQTFLTEVAEPAYTDWCHQPLLRKRLFLQRLRLQEKAARTAAGWRNRLLRRDVSFLQKTLDPIR